MNPAPRKHRDIMVAIIERFCIHVFGLTNEGL